MCMCVCVCVCAGGGKGTDKEREREREQVNGWYTHAYPLLTTNFRISDVLPTPESPTNTTLY